MECNTRYYITIVMVARRHVLAVRKHKTTPSKPKNKFSLCDDNITGIGALLASFLFWSLLVSCGLLWPLLAYTINIVCKQRGAGEKKFRPTALTTLVWVCLKCLMNAFDLPY